MTRRADDALRTALVTGACSGIGLAMAGQLAAQGYTLVLVSHRPAELGATATSLAAAHGVPTHAIPMDLARPEAAAELYAAVRALGVGVDVLVNNAGFFFFGEVVDADPARAAAMLHLHVVTPSLLARHFGRDMRERGRGRILFVSSISAFRAFPGIAWYGATKRYLYEFATSLRSELSPYGVSVTVLAPGATATGLYDPNVVDVPLAKRLGVMLDADDVARAGLRGLFRGQALVIPGLLARLMVWGARIAPQWLIDVIRRRGPWLHGRD